MAEERRSNAQARIAMLACAAGCFGPCAVALSCAGIFLTPVSESLGVSRALVSPYITVMLVVAALSLPLLGKISNKVNARAVLCPSILAVSIPLACLSQATAIWHFYLAGAIMGVGLGELLFLATPVLINRCFEEGAGVRIGICMALTGVGGAIFSLLGGFLIAMNPEGWRLAYLTLGVLGAVIALPPALLLDSRPACDESATPVATSSKPALSQVFVKLTLYAILLNVALGMCQHLPSLASSLAEIDGAAATGSMLAAAVMIGQAVGKIALGRTSDAAGARTACIASTLFGLAGLTVLAASTNWSYLLLAAGFAFGVFYASSTVTLPLMAKEAFEPLSYSALYSRVAMAGVLTGALAVTAWGFLIDAAGFTTAIIVAAILSAASGLIGLWSSKATGKLSVNQTHEAIA